MFDFTGHWPLHPYSISFSSKYLMVQWFSKLNLKKTKHWPLGGPQKHLSKNLFQKHLFPTNTSPNEKSRRSLPLDLEAQARTSSPGASPPGTGLPQRSIHGLILGLGWIRLIKQIYQYCWWALFWMNLQKLYPLFPKTFLFQSFPTLWDPKLLLYKIFCSKKHPKNSPQTASNRHPVTHRWPSEARNASQTAKACSGVSKLTISKRKCSASLEQQLDWEGAQVSPRKCFFFNWF